MDLALPIPSLLILRQMQRLQCHPSWITNILSNLHPEGTVRCSNYIFSIRPILFSCFFVVTSLYFPP